MWQQLEGVDHRAFLAFGHLDRGCANYCCSREAGSEELDGHVCGDTGGCDLLNRSTTTVNSLLALTSWAKVELPISIGLSLSWRIS